MYYINSVLINAEEDPSLRIESFAVINLRGVSTKLYFNLLFTMQTCKKFIRIEQSGAAQIVQCC